VATELKTAYATFKGLEAGEMTQERTEARPRKAEPEDQPPKKAAPPVPAMTLEEAFTPDQVACLVCGKRGLKTLKRHLSSAHQMKPAEYRRLFEIPKDQPLAAVTYVEKRRQMAMDRGLGENLAKARAARMANRTA
jgi:predicted transcriptional regulator